MASTSAGAKQLVRAQDLQQQLLSRVEELRRPVMAVSRTEEQRQEEAQTIRQLASKLNEVQSKLRVLQSITDAPERSDDKLRIFMSLDECRESLLRQARHAEAGAFVSKDVIKSIIDFCTVKNPGKAQPGGTSPAPDYEALNSKPSGIPKFKGIPAGGAVRDDQPVAHVDQAEGHLHSAPGVASTPAPVTPSSATTLRNQTQLSVKTRPSLLLPTFEQSDSPLIPASLSQPQADDMLRQGNDISDRSSDASTGAAVGSDAALNGHSNNEPTATDPAFRPFASRIKSFNRPDSESEAPAAVRPSSLIRDGSSNGRQLSGIASFKDRYESKKEDATAKDSPSSTNKPLVPRLRLGAALESSNSSSSVPAESIELAPGSPTAAASLTSPVVLQASPRLPPEGAIDTNQQTNMFRTMSRRTDSIGNTVPNLQSVASGSSSAGPDNSAAGSPRPGVAAGWRARDQGSNSGEQPAAPAGGSSILNRISSFNSAAADRNSPADAPTGTGVFNRISSFNNAGASKAAPSLKSASGAGNKFVPTSSAPTAAPYIPTAPALAMPSPSFKLRPVGEAKADKAETRPEPPPEAKPETESTSPAATPAPSSTTSASNPVLAAREQLREQLNRVGPRSNLPAKPSPITAAATIMRGISKHSTAASDASAFADANTAASVEDAEPPVTAVPLRPTPARAASSSSQPTGRAASGTLENVPDLAPSISASGTTDIVPNGRVSTQAAEADPRASTSDGGMGPPRRVTANSEELLMASPLIKHFANQQNRRAQATPAAGNLPHAVIAAGHQVAHTGLISAPVRYTMPAHLNNRSGGGVNGMDLMMMDGLTVVSMGGYSDEGGLDAEIAQHNPADRDAYLRGRKRGPWGMILRVLGLATTAVTIAAATGLAICAAAALNTGLDELNDRQHAAETGKRHRPRRGRGRHGQPPLLPFLPAPSTPEDTLAAGRG